MKNISTDEIEQKPYDENPVGGKRTVHVLLHSCSKGEFTQGVKC